MLFHFLSPILSQLTDKSAKGALSFKDTVRKNAYEKISKGIVDLISSKTAWMIAATIFGWVQTDSVLFTLFIAVIAVIATNIYALYKY